MVTLFPFSIDRSYDLAWCVVCSTVLLLVTGCGEDADPGPSGAITTFQLLSQTQEAVYVQLNRDCSPLPAWLDIVDSDGQPVEWNAPCGTCRCDLPEACAGDCGDVCFASKTTTLFFGGMVEWTWNNRLHETTEAGCDQIERAPSTGLSARFCWGYDQEDQGIEQFVVAPECTDVPFSPGRTVVHRLFPRPEQ